MSVKIYTAYRLKEGVDLWGFCRRVKATAKKNARAVLVEFMKHSIRSEKIKDSETMWKFDVPREILGLYKTAAVSHERSPFDFDVNLCFRELDGRVYLIPYGDHLMRNVWDFLESDSDVENFQYWNNTDEPEGMDLEEWRDRGEKWNKIDEVGWANFLMLEVCSVQSFLHVLPDLWDDEWEEIKEFVLSKVGEPTT